jgi:hypothetical protein
MKMQAWAWEYIDTKGVKWRIYGPNSEGKGICFIRGNLTAGRFDPDQPLLEEPPISRWPKSVRAKWRELVKTAQQKRGKKGGAVMKTKTVEEKLFLACRHNRGVRLTAGDVYDLVARDRAVFTRISNAAGQEAGLGADAVDMGNASIKTAATTWRQFVAELAREAGLR